MMRGLRASGRLEIVSQGFSPSMSSKLRQRTCDGRPVGQNHAAIMVPCFAPSFARPVPARSIFMSAFGHSSVDEGRGEIEVRKPESMSPLTIGR